MRSARVLTACSIVAVVFVATTGGAGSPSPSNPRVAKRLIGTWQLVSFESNDQENPRVRGAHPTGLISYDATGHMAVQIMPDRARQRFTGAQSPVFAGPQPTPEEALDAVSGYTAYFGTYVIDERTSSVTHHRLGNIDPGALGDFVRRYAFATDDRLILTPVENQSLRIIRTIWERLK